MTFGKLFRRRCVFSAMFAALIAVSSFFIIPIGVIPVVLKNFFVVLSGTILGSFYGGMSVLIFIIPGLCGMPIFVVPGFAVFNTPAGGYIFGYLLAALVSGFICGTPKTCEKKIKPFLIIRLSLASLLGFTLILACGVFYLMRLNSMSFTAAFIAGALPYILGDLIKLALCVPLSLKLRPIAARYINSEGA